MITVNPDAIEEAVYDADMDPDEAIHDDYSGRAMYGEKCFALVCSMQELVAFVLAYARENDDNDWLGNVRQDSFGLSTIWYWPGVKVGEEAAA